MKRIEDTKLLVDMIVKTNCVVETTSILSHTENYIDRNTILVNTDLYRISYDMIDPMQTYIKDDGRPLIEDDIQTIKYIYKAVSGIRSFANAHLDNSVKLLECYDHSLVFNVKESMLKLNDIYNKHLIEINAYRRKYITDRNKFYNYYRVRLDNTDDFVRIQNEYKTLRIQIPLGIIYTGMTP